MTQLIPWRRNGSSQMTPFSLETREPLLSLHREVDRLFDDLWNGFGTLTKSYSAMQWPAIELESTDEEIVLKAELPGMDEKNVDVEFIGQEVVIRGERREEKSAQGRRASEMFYGKFERRIPLDVEIEPDKAKATFHNGVLTVSLPKAPQARTRAVKIKVSKAH